MPRSLVAASPRCVLLSTCCLHREYLPGIYPVSTQYLNCFLQGPIELSKNPGVVSGDGVLFWHTDWFCGTGADGLRIANYVSRFTSHRDRRLKLNNTAQNTRNRTTMEG